MPSIAPICPECRGRLDLEAGHCVCCGRNFRSVRGILDLRIADDEYLANEEDREFARRLDREFDRLDFRGLLGLYFDLSPEIAPDQRRRQIAHILSAPGRANQWLKTIGSAAKGPLLDLGCGPGAFLAATVGDSEEAWGVDIALRWLILARKRLDEAGLDHVGLVCACAEGLPFEDGAFSSVIAGDVFEHVRDQAATLRESHRILKPGGKIVLASPNRFSLSPEPHVGVFGVGYWPRRLMAGYVRAASGRDFRAIRSLGLGEWRRILRESPFEGGSIVAPTIPEAERSGFGRLKRLVAGAYNAVVENPLGQWLALRIGPLFQVVAEKSPATSSSSRAIRRRSRRPAGRT